MPPPPGTPYFVTIAATARKTRGAIYGVTTGTCILCWNGAPGHGLLDTVIGSVYLYYGAVQAWNPITRQGLIGIGQGDGSPYYELVYDDWLADGNNTITVVGSAAGYSSEVIGGTSTGLVVVTPVAAPVPPTYPGGTRAFACGFEIQQTGPGPESVDQQKGRTPGRITGHAFTIAGFVDGVTPGSTYWSVNPADGVTRRSHLERFYIRVRERPNASGGLRIHGVVGSIEGTDDAFITVLEQDGTLAWYNKGNGARTLACKITTALELNVWYRVSLFYCFNNSGNAFAADDTGVFAAMVRKANDPHRLIINGDPATNVYDVMFNDTDSPVISGATGTLFNVALNVSGLGVRGTYSQTNWAGYKGGHVTANGLSYSSSQKWSRTHFGISNFAQVDTDGGTADVDDAVGDLAVCPGPGWITPWHVAGAGTYAEWSGNQDYRSVQQQPTSSGSSSPNAVINNVTGGKKISFYCVPPPGTTGAIRSVQVGIYGGIARNNWSMLLRVNTVDHTIAQVARDTTNHWLTLTGSLSGNGWLVDANAIGGISGSDLLEIGIIDGTEVNANTSWISNAVLLVEHESPDPTPVDQTLQLAIRCEIGSFTGNGTFQDIATALGAPPDWLLLRPDGANGGTIWHAGHGPNGQYGVRLDASDTTRSGLTQVSQNGFSVVQNGFSNTNPAATVVRYLAISDPSRRMVSLGGYMPNSSGAATVADPTITLNEFRAIEALIVQAGFSSGTGKHSYVGPGSGVPAGGANKSSYLDQATADRLLAITSFTTGSFVVGSVLDSVNFNEGFYTALRATGVFFANTLLQIGYYIGNGLASQDIVFPIPLAAAGLVIVIPTTARQRVYRFQPNTGGLNLTSGAAVAGSITAFSATGFTVGNTNNHNAALEVYNWIAFGVGQDLGPPIPPIDAEIDPSGLSLALAMSLAGTGLVIDVAIPPGALSTAAPDLDFAGTGAVIDVAIDPSGLAVTPSIALAAVVVLVPCPDAGPAPAVPVTPLAPLDSPGAPPTPPAPPNPCT